MAVSGTRRPWRLLPPLFEALHGQAMLGRMDLNIFFEDLSQQEFPPAPWLGLKFVSRSAG